MSRLGILQEAIAKDVFNYGDGSFEYIKKNGQLTGQQRFEINKVTVHENYINALKIVYPGVWRLVGENCARGLVMSYISHESHLPKDGSFDSFGVELPKYIESIPILAKLGYLPDFAKMEWFRQLAYNAKRSKIVLIERLQEYSEDELEHAKIILNESLYIMRSRYDLDEIQAVLNGEREKMQLVEGDFYFAVFRKGFKTVTCKIESIYWNFLDDLSQGTSFHVALNKLLSGGGDPVLALELIFTNELVAKIKIN